MYDVVIIGGGASGLMCASRLSNFPKKKILIIDKKEKLGKKLLATGSGRCNLSNQDLNIKHYHSNNTLFLDTLYKQFKEIDVIKYFNNIGLNTTVIDEGYYPQTEQAISVLDILKLKIEENNINIRTDIEVTSVLKKEEYLLKTTSGDIKTKSVVFATGGCASPKFGSDGSGFKLLNSLGHTVLSLYPSLVPLITKDKALTYLKGLRLKAKATILINDKVIASELGQVQFNNDSLSGICIMNLSSAFVPNSKVTIELDLIPDISKDDLKESLIKRQKDFPDRLIDFYLTGLLANKVSFALYKRLNINYENKVKDLTVNQIDSLVNEIKAFSFLIDKTKDYSYAQVCGGGIDTNEITENYESKIHKDLYIIGELLDVCGDCGGYNLHFAFTSGIIAANSIGGKYN